MLEYVNQFEFFMCVKSAMKANTSSDYTDINITVAMITVDSFQQLKVCFVFE